MQETRGVRILNVLVALIGPADNSERFARETWLSNFKLYSASAKVRLGTARSKSMLNQQGKYGSVITYAGSRDNTAVLSCQTGFFSRVKYTYIAQGRLVIEEMTNGPASQ